MDDAFHDTIKVDNFHVDLLFRIWERVDHNWVFQVIHSYREANHVAEYMVHMMLVGDIGTYEIILTD